MCMLNNLKIKQRLFSFLNIENGPSMSDKSKTIVLVRFIFPTKMCSKVYLSIRKGFGTTSKPVNVMVKKRRAESTSLEVKVKVSNPSLDYLSRPSNSLLPTRISPLMRCFMKSFIVKNDRYSNIL